VDHIQKEAQCRAHLALIWFWFLILVYFFFVTERNVEGILQFLTTRNNAQRQLIIREFFRRYRRV